MKVEPGETHSVGVAEMRSRKNWWRVWVDGKRRQQADLPSRKPRHVGAGRNRRELERRLGQVQQLRLPVLAREVRHAAEPRLAAHERRDKLEDTGYRVTRANGGFLARGAI